MVLAVLCLVLDSCAVNKRPTEDKTLLLYNDLLQKVISEEEMFSDEGFGYPYSEAEDPGFALYDIDKDGTDELFVTARMDSEWHTYVVYSIKGDNVRREKALNGYIPDKGCFTYSFDFFVEAYVYNSKDGFVKIWELDYPWVDGYTVNTINYEGKEPREIPDNELEKLLSGHITEPVDILWMPLKEDTDIATEIAGRHT